MPDTLNNMPMCECPHCGHTWQEDDYYNLRVGGTVTCPNPQCEQEITITERETTLMLRFATETTQGPPV